MMKTRWNKILMFVFILAGGFFFWNPTVHAADEAPADVTPKVNKNQAMKLTPEQIKAFIKKNGKIKTGPRITNSKAVERRAAIIATLRTQKQAADAQRATFRAAIKVAPTSPALTPPSAQPMASPSTSLMQSRSGPAGNLQMSKNVPSIGSSRLESEKVKPALNIPSAAVVQGKVSNIQMACTPDRQGIWDINGMARKKIIFTPDPEYHIYVISGCGFGNSRGAVHLSGPFVSGVVNMAIESWEDTQIVASIDPSISGELDHDNVTLVLAPVGKPPMQDTGHKFYAVRETVLLPTIPDIIKTIEYHPGVDIYTVKNDNNFPGYSNEVDRYQGLPGEFSSAPVPWADGGSDFYDFSHHLKPGFTTDSYESNYFSYDPWHANCNHTYNSSLSVAWIGDDIRVKWVPFSCFREDILNGGYIISSYALSVWLVGPKGVDPWQ